MLSYTLNCPWKPNASLVFMFQPDNKDTEEDKGKGSGTAAADVTSSEMSRKLKEYFKSKVGLEECLTWFTLFFYVCEVCLIISNIYKC